MERQAPRRDHDETTAPHNLGLGIITTDGNAAQLSFRSVVCHLERAVVEEAHQRVLLPNAVTQGGAQHAALVLDLFVCVLGELEERNDVHAKVAIAERLADVRKPILPRVV